MSNRRSADRRWGFLGTRGRTYGEFGSRVFQRSLLPIMIGLASSAAYTDPVRLVIAGVADAHEGQRSGRRML